MQQDLMEKTSAVDKGERPPYQTPQIQRVDLALEETLSSGCKVWGELSPCGDEFAPGEFDGS